MTFSIRTILIAVAIVAVWLGALVSKSPLVIEIVTNATGLMILLILAFAIWDRQPEQRAFWTGFFVLAFGNLVLASYLSTYQRTGAQVAQLLVGQQTPQVAGMPYGLQWTPVNPAATNVPVPVTTFTGSYSYTLSGAVGQTPDYFQQIEAIRSAVPMLAGSLKTKRGKVLPQRILRNSSSTLPPSHWRVATGAHSRNTWPLAQQQMG